MNEKRDEWSDVEDRAHRTPNGVTTLTSATLLDLIEAARANVNPGATRLREVAAKGEDVQTFMVTISQTVEVDAKILKCGNCGVVGPHPPASVLGAAALEYVKGSSGGKRALVQSGNFHYGKWSPDGWTAAQHFNGAMICAECTECVVNALAKRRPPVDHEAAIAEINAATIALSDAHKIVIVGDGSKGNPKRLQCERCLADFTKGGQPLGVARPCVPPANVVSGEIEA